jgi:hypothetical protein
MATYNGYVTHLSQKDDLLHCLDPALQQVVAQYLGRRPEAQLGEMRWYFSASCHQQMKEAQLGGSGDKWALECLVSSANEVQAEKETPTRRSSGVYEPTISIYLETECPCEDADPLCAKNVLLIKPSTNKSPSSCH